MNTLSLGQTILTKSKSFHSLETCSQDTVQYLVVKELKIHREVIILL